MHVLTAQPSLRSHLDDEQNSRIEPLFYLPPRSKSRSQKPQTTFKEKENRKKGKEKEKTLLKVDCASGSLIGEK